MRNRLFPTLPGATVPPDKAIQGIVSYAIVVTALLSALLVASSLAWPFLSANAALRAQSSQLSTISAALTREKETLAERLRIVGAEASGAAPDLSSAYVTGQLDRDAERFRADMEGAGFRLTQETPHSETQLSATLSSYVKSLTFSGDAASVSAFLAEEGKGDMRVASLKISAVTSRFEQSEYMLNVTLTRLGAPSTPQTDKPGANAGD